MDSEKYIKKISIDEVKEILRPNPAIFTKTLDESCKDEEQTFRNFNYNVLKLNENELYILGWQIISEFSFFEIFKIELNKWTEFIWMLHKKYTKKKNSFHNFYHALSGNKKFL